MISQSGGHGDFRLPYEVPSAPNAPLSHGDAIGGGTIADGVEAVLKRSREQLMMGATQLKLAAGGGVSSNYDPIDVSQVYRSRIPCGGRGGRELGHLCYRACLYAESHTNRIARRCEMYRSCTTDG